MSNGEKAYVIWIVSVLLAVALGIWLGAADAIRTHQQAMDALRRSINQTQPEYIRASTQSCIHIAAQQLQRCEELSRSLR